MILILSNRHDLTVDLGILAFRRRGLPYARINTEELAPDLVLQGDQVVLTGLPGVDVAEVRAVWYRRPQFYQGQESLPSLQREFVEDEHRAAWFDAFEALRGARWMNWPDANRRAGRRLTMLRHAISCGLRVPASRVTRSAGDVLALLHEVGPVVAKSVGAGYRDDETGHAAFTHLVRRASEVPDDLGDAPVLVQAFVEKRADWRVTAFGERIISVRIHSQDEDSARVDWRQSERPLHLEEVQLPDEVARGVQRFMTSLGLSFGAFDFVEDQSGSLWFLEVNPNGQWGWMEQEAGLQLSEALAEALWGE